MRAPTPTEPESRLFGRSNLVRPTASVEHYEGTKTLPTPKSDFTPQTFYAISKAADHLLAKAYQQFFGWIWWASVT